MKVLVVGLGSMGKRRIRLLKQIRSDVLIAGIDMKKERRNDLDIDTYESLEDAIELFKPDMAIVCTSPLSHRDIIRKCLKCGLDVFTEINLVQDGYLENIELAESKNRILFLSSTFLYRDEIRYIRNEVKNITKNISYIYHVGQYLPDWHPWENYRDYFIGDRKTNGCRELLAIELPWITQTFGEIKKVQAIWQKSTELDIEYPECVHMLITHKNGNVGSISIDVVSRIPVRDLEIVGEDIYLTWKGTPDSLMKYNVSTKENIRIELISEPEHKDGYASFIIENAYFNELNAFLESVNNRENTFYGFKEDLQILEIIDKIEEMK